MRWITMLFVFVLAVASLGAAENPELDGEQKARFDALHREPGKETTRMLRALH